MLPFKRKKLSHALCTVVSPVVENDLPETRISFSSILGKPTISAYLFMYNYFLNKLSDPLFDTSETIPLKNYVPKFSFDNLGSRMEMEPKLHHEISVWHRPYEILKNENAQVEFYKKMMQLV